MMPCFRSVLLASPAATREVLSQPQDATVLNGRDTENAY